MSTDEPVKTIWTNPEKNWTLFNIHTSDRLEIFFRSLNSCKRCTHGIELWGIHRLLGGMNHENGVYSMGQCHECCIYRNRVIERASEFWPLPIFVSLAFTNKKECEENMVNFHVIRILLFANYLIFKCKQVY